MIDATGLVSGRYTVGELLGTGGSASVYASVDTRTGAAVALKILHPHLSERPAARAAFLTEAARAEPLRHPNIVGVLGVGVDSSGDTPVAWIALERAAGSSLSEHVARFGPLAPSEAISVADGVLRALEAAHAIGLIHRDVSPANIMVARAASGVIESSGVRLLDFGLADAAGRPALGTDDLLSVEATGRAGVLGNVNYISPEQVRGDPVDERGDIYQVGGMLYFALTGRLPFARETIGQTMRAHLDSPPPVPSATDPRIPRTLDRIVVRAMLKSPDDRFVSAAEMRAAVGAAVALTGVAQDKVSTAVLDARTATAADEASGGAAVAGGKAAVAATAASTTGAAASFAAAAVPADSPRNAFAEVTRVLGRTIVPPRAHGGSGAGVSSWTHQPRRSKPRAGLVFAMTTAAIATAIVIAVAVTTAPPSSAEAEPTATATPAAVQPTEEPSPEPSSEPPVPEPVVVMTAVPDLARQSVSEAARALAEAGLVAGEVTYVDSVYLRDTVLQSEPAAGDRAAHGGPVTLIVASGFNTIPDVAGMGRDAALAAVQSAGFAPSLGHRSVSAAAQAGSVVGSDPGPGARLAVGTSISVLEGVFAGPTPSPTQGTPEPTSQPTSPSVGG